MQNTVLWIYIVLLVVGGVMGYLKAKSKVSLYMACGFAAGLVLCAIPRFFDPAFQTTLANVLMAILLVVFAIRLAKTKKFMPAGLLVIATVVTLALRNLNF